MQRVGGGSFVIEFGQLWTSVCGDDGTWVRLPLTSLPDADGEHVHGSMRIVVDGRPLPALGFFGPDDVCLNAWTYELVALRRVLESSDPSVYRYDEGEQGQPAYQFRRDGDQIRVSVTEGMGGGGADPTWVDVVCNLSDVVAAVDAYVEALATLVRAEAGDRGSRWIRYVLPPDERERQA